MLAVPGHAQPSTRGTGPHAGQSFGKGLEPGANDGEELFTGPSQRERPRTPPEQGLSAMTLEQLDLVADRGRRHVKLGSGPLEAQMSGRSLEGSQLGQGWQLTHRPSLDETTSSAAELFALA